MEGLLEVSEVVRRQSRSVPGLNWASVLQEIRGLLGIASRENEEPARIHLIVSEGDLTTHHVKGLEEMLKNASWKNQKSDIPASEARCESSPCAC